MGLLQTNCPKTSNILTEGQYERGVFFVLKVLMHFLANGLKYALSTHLDKRVNKRTASCQFPNETQSCPLSFHLTQQKINIETTTVALYI